MYYWSLLASTLELLEIQSLKVLYQPSVLPTNIFQTILPLREGGSMSFTSFRKYTGIWIELDTYEKNDHIVEEGVSVKLDVDSFTTILYAIWIYMILCTSKYGVGLGSIRMDDDDCTVVM